MIAENITTFLSKYNEQVIDHAHKLRAVLLEALPNIQEQLDLPAKMIAYCYGQKYAELICMLIPSKKGLKLGFYKGIELADPHQLLQGTGKISRYVEIKTEEDINSFALKDLLTEALEAYKQRMGVV